MAERVKEKALSQAETADLARRICTLLALVLDRDMVGQHRHGAPGVNPPARVSHASGTRSGTFGHVQGRPESALTCGYACAPVRPSTAGTACKALYLGSIPSAASVRSVGRAVGSVGRHGWYRVGGHKSAVDSSGSVMFGRNSWLKVP